MSPTDSERLAADSAVPPRLHAQLAAAAIVETGGLGYPLTIYLQPEDLAHIDAWLERAELPVCDSARAGVVAAYVASRRIDDETKERRDDATR